VDTMIHISPADYSFILTNALSESGTEDRSWFKEIENMAKARNAVFIPVRLLCSAEEREKRIVQPDRKDRKKAIDPRAPRRHSETDEVLKVDHPNLLTLDVTSLKPEQAAGEILVHARHMAATLS
jgi:hypothetical protein